MRFVVKDTVETDEVVEFWLETNSDGTVWLKARKGGGSPYFLVGIKKDGYVTFPDGVPLTKMGLKPTTPGCGAVVPDNGVIGKVPYCR